MKRGKVELFERAGHYWFHVKAANGQILVTSETYKTKRAAYKGITALRRACSYGRVVDKSR